MIVCFIVALQSRCSVEYGARTRPGVHIIAIQVEDFTPGQSTTALSSAPLQVGVDHTGDRFVSCLTTYYESRKIANDTVRHGLDKNREQWALFDAGSCDGLDISVACRTID